MTKYILNSGGLRRHPEKAKEFNLEVVKGLGNTPLILFCFFATPRERWEEKFADYSSRFLESMPAGVAPKIELALPEKFVDQLKNSDAVIINGGDDNLLLHYLKQYDLPAAWQGKVVAGSSAGSDALVKHFWTCDWRKCLDGLGILPIKFIPHYKSGFGDNDPRGAINWSLAYQELVEYGDQSLPIHALQEGDFVVIEIF
jgi:peptidase E